MCSTAPLAHAAAQDATRRLYGWLSVLGYSTLLPLAPDRQPDAAAE